MDPSAAEIPAGKPPRLRDRLRNAIRLRHHRRRTEDASADPVRRFILFHPKRHPQEMGAAEINQFLTHLAVEGHVSASTQNQAFAALLFLSQNVLEVDPGRIAGVVRAKRPERLPVVLARDEIKALFAFLYGILLVVGTPLHGAGIRLREGLRLRVHDLGFLRNEILVRDGKGHKDRMTMLPGTVQGRRDRRPNEIPS